MALIKITSTITVDQSAPSTPVTVDSAYIAYHLTAQNWSLASPPVLSGNDLVVIVNGAETDNLAIVATAFNGTLSSAHVIGTGTVAQFVTDSAAENNPATDKGIEDYLRDIGKALSFDTESAVIGGALAAVVILAILLKK